jgi:hypothetical protein
MKNVAGFHSFDLGFVGRLRVFFRSRNDLGIRDSQIDFWGLCETDSAVDEYCRDKVEQELGCSDGCNRNALLRKQLCRLIILSYSTT